MRPLNRVVVAVAVVFCAASIARSEDLLSHVPSNANAVAIIDVDKLLASPLGVREKWKEKFKNAYASAPLVVPPNASRVVMAASIDPTTMQSCWEVSAMDLAAAPSMEQIARAEGGYVDSLAGKQAAWSPINAYFVRLDNHVLGSVAPANRQFATRWAASANSPDSMNPYLKAAVDSRTDRTCYLFAMDLADATSQRKVKRRMQSGDFASLASKEFDPEKVSQVIASIKGITLDLGIREDINGSAVVEFGKSAGALADFAKPLLLEALGKFGVAVDDFQSWTPSIEGNKLTLTGSLSTDGFRQLLHIVDPPAPLVAAEAESKQPAAPKDSGPNAAASKQYYQAVAKILENTGKRVRNATSMTQGATWVARDARFIDRLPILNVDPDLLNWGMQMSAGLRDMAGVVGVGGLQAQARTISILEGTGSSGGGGGDYTESEHDYTADIARQNTQRQRIAAAKEQKAKTGQAAAQIYAALEASRSQIRAAMVQRYKIEF
ncbi:MAG TPA: hypothetical protein VMV81_07570 [Phycisphaerae bacterium]|nr:hypothetical protein [Phycisphaerae bacterium]